MGLIRALSARKTQTYSSVSGNTEALLSTVFRSMWSGAVPPGFKKLQASSSMASIVSGEIFDRMIRLGNLIL